MTQPSARIGRIDFLLFLLSPFLLASFHLSRKVIVARNLPGAQVDRIEGCEACLECRIIDVLGMQLPGDVIHHASFLNLFDIAGSRAVAQAVQNLGNCLDVIWRVG